MYVALAEWLGVPLITTDARLAAAPGIKATVEVVPLVC
jgi:predicted nucleic acid-binding protein